MGCSSCGQARMYTQPAQPTQTYQQPYQAPTMGFDWGTFVFGFVTGGILAMLFVTQTGRGIMGAAGHRVQRRINR